MKEVLGSLPEVITAYKNYNLLVPTATDVQLNPFYKFHVEEVPVDLGENSGDIFKVGSVKTGKQDEKGKDIWEDVFSLSKPLLNKMAMAAGIQFNPKETYGERIDRVTYRAQAQGAMRKADGTARTETDQKVICLEDEEEKYRIEFADKAAKGITDEKQAQAAAEIFSGQWVESKNKWGKKCQAFVVAKEDRDRYVERSVMVNMALLKKTWAEKAMTGAKLRVIRALLALRAECEKTPILMAHYTVPGCNMESGQTSFFTNFEPVIPREALMAARYEAVLLGHIHRPQIIEGLDNVFYSGAINAMNFNDEGQDRGFWIHEFNEKGTLVKGHKYTTPYRQFHTITWDPDEAGDYIREGAMYLHRTGISEDVTDKIVRVRYSCTSEQKKALNIPLLQKNLYKVLGKLKNFEIFNSGMLSKQSQSGESYRIMAGSDVSDAIDKDSGRMYSAGHAFCKAVDNAEGDVTIGYSSASKVWSSAYKDLKDYIQWCDGLGKKIANKDIKVKTNTNFDFLPQPKALVEYPEDIFYADFTAETYSCDPVIKYRRKESDYECCRLTDAMVVVKNCEKTKVSVEVSVGEISENLECDIKARYRSLGNRFIVCSGKEEIPMDKFLTEQPLIYKTVKDMTITGIDVIEGDFESELFDSNIIEGVDWKHYDTNLKLEFRKNDSDTRVSIQDALYKILEADEKFKYIIYDHGSGEMADYITIYETDNELVVELYHVKKMGSSSYNNSVGDVYEVSGQAIKSVTWFTTKGKLLEKFTSRHNSGHCIVKKGGNFKTMIKEIKTSGKVLRGCICIVQPGIKKSKAIPDRIQEVLAATDSYVKKAGKVNRLRIMGSI